MNKKAKPFIKWVGGKGQLIEQLIPTLRDIQAQYYALPDIEAKREMFMAVRQRYNEKNLDPIENTAKKV